MTKTALVTGVTGQDGAYLTAHLAKLGYRVVGGVRPHETPETWRLAELGVADRVSFVPFELLDAASMARTVGELQPDEIYNLAAQSSVAASLKAPLHTADVDGLGVCRLLEAIRTVSPATRLFQASSADMFGVAETPRQNESSPFSPRSPYAAAKLFAHHTVSAYRDSFGTFAVSGILFNHESPMRALGFVTRKITAFFATKAVRPAEATVLELGNLDTKRDWGFAGDYVVAMHAMLQRDVPSDYVLATGVTHSVRDFVNFVAQAVGRTLVWSGQGATSQAHDEATGELVVRVNPAFFRPNEVDGLSGDATRARTELGFAPSVPSLAELARVMVEADCARCQGGPLVR
jgi:GDPmannose 4,6-dehydratase